MAPPVDDAELDRAVTQLRAGGLVALPTETVYGLAADAENELAVRRIFAVKGRPATHPLIVHLADAVQLPLWTEQLPARVRPLAEALWPGPLTLVLRRSARVSDAVTGGQETVAVRVPAHPLAHRLLERFGGGLAAPSANRFGAVSPTTAEHVRADLGDDVDLVLDGGPCVVGIESTIVDLTQDKPVILRPGGVSRETLEQVLGEPVPVVSSATTRAPGLLASHYAPRAGLQLVEPQHLGEKIEAAIERGQKVAVMGALPAPLPTGVGRFPLPEDAAGYARGLYATLREIDLAGYTLILATPPPPHGLGMALGDRLRKAAAPRIR